MMLTPEEDARVSMARLLPNHDFTVMLGWMNRSLEYIKAMLLDKDSEELRGGGKLLNEIFTELERAESMAAEAKKQARPNNNKWSENTTLSTDYSYVDNEL
jgi:hypothetical protein